MKHIAFSLTLLLCLTAGHIHAQNTIENYIEVHGTAERKIVPDRITLTILIRETDYKNRSLTTLEKEMKNALSREGIRLEKDLKVSDMSSIFSKTRSNRQDARLSKAYTLLVKDAVTASRCMDALDSIGISNVSVEKAEYSQLDSLKMTLKGEAVKNARDIASAMTGAIGQKIGPAFFIYEQESYNDNFQPRMLMAQAKSMMNDGLEAEAALPELEFQEMKITSRVTVRFTLLP